MRKLIFRRGLPFLILVVVAGALVIPYYRQLLFGPKYQGVPLCVWQEQLRRQTLGENDKGWIAKALQWLQPKTKAEKVVRLTREEQIDIWLTLLDDPAPAMRVRSIQALWGSAWGGRWHGGYVSYWAYGNSLEVSSADVMFVRSAKYELMLGWEGGWSTHAFPGGQIQPAPPVAPHLVRMLDDSNVEVRQAAFGALAGLGPHAAAALPRLLALLDHADAARRAQAARTLNAVHDKTRPWLERLIRLLDDANSDVRGTAADCLAGWSDRRLASAAGPALVKLLRDPEPQVRIQAAAALAALQVHLGQATEALRACMRHPDAGIRSHAISTLFARAGAAAYADLVHLARFDPDDNVRASATGALWHGGAQAVPVLVAILRSEKAELTNSAVQCLRQLGPKARPAVPYLVARIELYAANGISALADIGDAEAVPKLIELLDHRDLRNNALSALQTLGPHARSAVPKLLEMLSEQSDAVQQVANALVAIAGDRPHVFAALEQRARTELATQRNDTLWSFCQNGARASALVPAIIHRLENDPDPSYHALLVQLLGSIGPAAHRAVPTLLKLAREASDDLRPAIIRTLAYIGTHDQEVVPWLIDLLEHDRHIGEVIFALGQFGPRARSARPHLRGFLDCYNPDHHSAAINALASIESPKEIVQTLDRSVRHPNDTVRIAAARALCAAGAPAASIPRVVPLLADEREHVRQAVVQALGEMGPAALAATPALARLIDDDRQWLADAVRDALAQIEP